MRASLTLFVLLVAGASSAQTPGPFVYAGFLEENGVPVDGTRNLVLTPFSGALDVASCAAASFAAFVVVNAGRFSVPLDSVPPQCMATGELFLEVAVGEVDGVLVPLRTSDNNPRIALAATPFAAAAQAGGLDARQGVVFTPLRGPSTLQADGSGTAVRLRPSGALLATDPVLRVESAAQGRALLSVLEGDEVQVSRALTIAKAPGTPVSSLTLLHEAGVGNDPALIEHDETTANVGLLWLNSSDDWDAASANDKIIFGQRVGNHQRHVFDGAGNATHAGALSVAGNATVTGNLTVTGTLNAQKLGCPAGMEDSGAGFCIDVAKRLESAYASSVVTCADESKRVCSFSELCTAIRRGVAENETLRVSDFFFFDGDNRQYMGGGPNASNQIIGATAAGCDALATIGPFSLATSFKCCR